MAIGPARFTMACSHLALVYNAALSAEKAGRQQRDDKWPSFSCPGKSLPGAPRFILWEQWNQCRSWESIRKGVTDDTSKRSDKKKKKREREFI